MLNRALHWALVHWRPAEGWPSLLLLAGAVYFLLAGILEVGWIREDGVIIPSALVGLAIALLLARKRPNVAVGGLVVTLCLGIGSAALLYLSRFNLWLILTGGLPAQLAWRRDALRMVARFLRWLADVLGRQPSRETIFFALLLGLAAGLLVAWLTWGVYRHRRPLTAAGLVALALALNSHYGGGPSWPLIGFSLCTLLLTADLHRVRLVGRWEKDGVDFTEEIQLELLVSAMFVTAGLGGLAVALIDVDQRLNRLAAAFQRSEPVQTLNESLDRAFGGVEPAGGPPSFPAGGPSGGEGAGVFPRSFLLGDPPELAQAPVFEAVVQGERAGEGLHWRATTYGVYTGRGWLAGDARAEPAAAGDPLGRLPLPPAALITQTVTWLGDGGPPGIYTLGRPLEVDVPTTAYRRLGGDLVRLEPASRSSLAVGGQRRYTAVSVLNIPGYETNQAPALSAEARAYYTRLPDGISERVRELAAEITAGAENSLDQARALEQFLRQYPYNLEAATIPPEVEPVDYFLFELQQGYCDYYATAMVVMARLGGLPARLGVGYLAQPTDGQGRQLVRRANSHSWAEVYIDGLGWVEFEPTGSFPERGRPLSEEAPAGAAPPLSPAPEIPLREENADRGWLWLSLGGIATLAGAAIYLAGRRRAALAGRDDLIWAFRRLQRLAAGLDLPDEPSLTPREFGVGLWTALEAVLTKEDVRARTEQTLQELIDAYERRQYGPPQSAGQTHLQNRSARAGWQALRAPLHRLWWHTRRHQLIEALKIRDKSGKIDELTADS